MAAFMPAWRPLDATHSVRLLSERPRGGRVVALCAAPGLAGRPEGARLATGLARRWTEGGLSVVLADGDLARPILHLSVGLANAKGLADLLLAGEAWGPMALETPVPGLRVIPAGGSAAPTSSEAARERLARLCLEVPADGSTLAFYVPLGTMLAEWVVDVCTDIVVLSGEGEPVSAFFAADEDRVRAHVGPPLPAQQRAMEPAMPPRAAETATGHRSALPPASPEDHRAGAADRGPQEARTAAADRSAKDTGAEGRSGRSATSRIEDRWAEAAAMVRARREGGPPGGATVGEPRADEALELPFPAPPSAPPPPPRAEPRAAPRAEPAAPPRAEPPAAPRAEPPATPRPRPVPMPGAKQRPAPYPAEAVVVEPPPRPPLPERPLRREEPPDPLATPPIMMAEWDRFGDEDEFAYRSGKRRTLLVRGLAALGGVVVVAGAVWLWNSSRGLPPYETRSTTLPRASIPAANTPGPRTEPGTDPGAESAAAAPETALPGDSGGVADSATVPGPSAAGSEAARPRPSARPAVPETGAPHQRYSWSMAAMGTMDAARGLVARLRRRAPDETFAIAPITSDGRTLYRVLGGLAADREELARIREPLGQATGQAAGSWLVREAPLAFALQDFDDAGVASAWVAELDGSGVPAYVLVVERDDGSTVHRVYAGAYANEAEASAMRGLLEGAGIRGATLTERKGRAGS